MQSTKKKSVAINANIILTPILLFACMVAVGEFAMAQKGAPPIPAPPREKPDDPPGGSEDVWKDKDGLEIRRDTYAFTGVRQSITITRRCPDGRVDEIETFTFGQAGGVQVVTKWEKWIYGCGPGNENWKRMGRWENETITEDGDTVPAKRTVIVREHTEGGRVVPASETVSEWDDKTGTWIRKTDGVGAVPGVGTSSAARGFAVVGEVDLGLNTTIFSTPHGRIRVYLPDDITAGDTISGTVMTEPAGVKQSEIALNQNELRGYVVELEKKTNSSAGILNSIIPAGASLATYLILKDDKMKEVARTSIPLTPSATHVNTFDLPGIGQQGRPVDITGPFDGDFGTTNLKVGGQNMELLAESPRKVVARIISKSLGLSQLEVREKNQVSRGEFRTVGIALSAPKLNLMKGEQTILRVEVRGLEDLTERLPLELANKTSTVIQLDGGNLQRMNIDPTQIQAGTYTTERSLTGIQGGAFTITGTIIRPRRRMVGSTQEAQSKEVNQPGFPWSTQESVVTRCRNAQTKRLEACETDECRQQARETLRGCEQLISDTSLSCSGIRPLQQCTVASPCNLGKDMDGDGTNDSCLKGARCAPASEGAVCDPGRFYDCVLVTVYYPKGPFRPLAECDCECK